MHQVYNDMHELRIDMLDYNKPYTLKNKKHCKSLIIRRKNA